MLLPGCSSDGRAGHLRNRKVGGSIPDFSSLQMLALILQCVNWSVKKKNLGESISCLKRFECSELKSAAYQSIY